jgi:hypothetical protein
LNVYLVVDDPDRNAGFDREADVETADLETVVFELFSGVKTLTASSPSTPPKVGRSVSTDITQALIRRCHLQMRDVPCSITSSSNTLRPRPAAEQRLA